MGSRGRPGLAAGQSKLWAWRHGPLAAHSPPARHARPAGLGAGPGRRTRGRSFGAPGVAVGLRRLGRDGWGGEVVELGKGSGWVGRTRNSRQGSRLLPPTRRAKGAGAPKWNALSGGGRGGHGRKTERPRGGAGGTLVSAPERPCRLQAKPPTRVATWARAVAVRECAVQHAGGRGTRVLAGSKQPVGVT